MNKYVFKPYNTVFAQLFEKEKNRLTSCLTKDCLIEHIGSTAIDNLGGKGIIDIIVSTDRPNLLEISQEIQKAGYEYREVASTPTRLFFRIDLKDPIEGTRRHHLHLVINSSQDWKESLTFKDYLKNNPEEAKKYNELKRKAAEEVNQEGQIYKKIKEPFIKEVMRKVSLEL